MNRPPHISEDFELELQSLRGAVLDMAVTAQGMVASLGKLCQEASGDVEFMRAQERELDHSELRVDEQARLILMRFQPMASDFREVTGALRISSDLEGIGDEASRIAYRCESLRPWVSADANDHLPHLWERSHQTIQQAIEAYSKHDVEKARAVLSRKHLLIKEAAASLRGISSAIDSRADFASLFLDAVGAATELERIGRIATNIAETVIFIETGKDVRHNINPS